MKRYDVYWTKADVSFSRSLPISAQEGTRCINVNDPNDILTMKNGRWIKGRKSRRDNVT